MAVDTPAHAQIGMLINLLHRLDLAMASLAIHAVLDVRRVVELNVIRQHVHTHPLQRLALVESIAHFLNVRAVGLHLHMAVHAGAERRNVRVLRAFDLAMAVLALHTVRAHMQAVIERDRLLGRMPNVVTPARLELASRQEEATKPNKESDRRCSQGGSHG